MALIYVEGEGSDDEMTQVYQALAATEPKEKP